MMLLFSIFLTFHIYDYLLFRLFLFLLCMFMYNYYFLNWFIVEVDWKLSSEPFEVCWEAVICTLVVSSNDLQKALNLVIN